MSSLPVDRVLAAIAKLPIAQQIRQLQVRLAPAWMPERDRRELQRYFIQLRLEQLRTETKGAHQ